MNIKKIKLGIDIGNVLTLIFALWGIFKDNWKLSVVMLLGFCVLSQLSLIIQLILKPINANAIDVNTLMESALNNLPKQENDKDLE